MTLSACSTVTGTAVPDPSVAAKFKLNTGGFPTSPRKVEAGNALDAWQQEGWRIASAVVTPWAFYPSLTKACSDNDDTAAPAFSAATLTKATAAMSTEQANIAGSNGYQTGFIACGDDKNKTRLRVGILRFTDEASAKRAVALIADKNPSEQHNVPANFPVRDATLTMLGANSAVGIASLTTMVARGNLVVVSGMMVPTAAGGPTAATVFDVVGKAMAAQVAKLGDYRQTPFTLAQGQSVIPAVPMDDDGIMGLTAPPSEAQGASGLSSKTAPLDGWGDAHTYTLNSHETIDGLERFGRAALNVVLRFTDDKASAEYMSQMYSGVKQPIAGISGQFGGCMAVPLANTAQTATFCVVRSGRYVGTAYSRTAEQAQQSASATYLRLKGAK
ncbi:hypothetical protein GCM10009648_04130 [Tsukamurella spumae]